MTKYKLHEVNKDEWDILWPKIAFSNMFQSWPYGEAKKYQGWKPYRYSIKDDHNHDVALVQVLENRIKYIGKYVGINRGPVYLDDPIKNPLSVEMQKSIWEAIQFQARLNKWLLIAWSPELFTSQNIFEIRSIIKPLKMNAWGSHRINLQRSEEMIFKSLKGKWRNLLRKSINNDSTIVEVNKYLDVKKLIDIYHDFTKLKGFKGIPPGFLHELYNKYSISDLIKVYKSVDNNDILLGFVFLVIHGDSATYLVGWSSQRGRALLVNYSLLWECVIYSKNKGIKWFDVGGLNANTPSGISHFKSGLNGEKYQNISTRYKIIL
jgi:lipid II:glycine glycyltransferase (peptidoglycan interpeptide bridge formation enzyme)